MRISLSSSSHFQLRAQGSHCRPQEIKTEMGESHVRAWYLPEATPKNSDQARSCSGDARSHWLECGKATQGRRTVSLGSQLAREAHSRERNQKGWNTLIGIPLIQHQGSWHLYKPTLQKHWLSISLSVACTGTGPPCCARETANRPRDADLLGRSSPEQRKMRDTRLAFGRRRPQSTLFCTRTQYFLPHDGGQAPYE